VTDSVSRLSTSDSHVFLCSDFVVAGEFHDQGDAKWIVIRVPLRGHNDTPFGRPTPGQPIGRPGVGRPSGVIGGFLIIIDW
jgi:hypothetical protein